MSEDQMSDWTPKPGDRAWYCDDVKVTIVAETDHPDIYDVRYADRDSRAIFAADRLELTPRTPAER
jgi:hypothetical protein